MEMFKILNTRLYVKIATLLAIFTLVISSISSLVFYKRSFNQELRHGTESARQLIDTVIETAAIAAYLNEYELGREVVKGLASNDLVAKATLTTSDGQLISSDISIPVDSDDIQQVIRPLQSPFTENKVGQLRLVPNRTWLETRARNISKSNAATLGFQTMIITLLVMILIYAYLTHPIRTIAKQLHMIVPGKDERLSYPNGHRQNEIGSLVTDANRLLGLSQSAIDRERNLLEQMRTLKRKYEKIFSQSYAAIFVVDHQGHLLTYNQSFNNIVPQTFLDETQSCDNIDIFTIFVEQELVRSLTKITDKKKCITELDLQLTVPPGHPTVWLHCIFTAIQENGKKHPLIEGVAFDVTERKCNEQNAHFQAEHDQLTGLLNRRGAEPILETLSSNRQRGHNPLIYLLDLDNFKSINDTYGHNAGDAVLIEIARRLTSNTRDGDCVIRWGGDEFMVIVANATDTNSIQNLGKKLVEENSQPIDLGNGTWEKVQTSIGIARFTEPIRDIQEWIRLADQAMYKVKQQGKNGFCLYDPEKNCYKYEFSPYS
jgi:diguanylate cyclase (GGDEF)-like protein